MTNGCANICSDELWRRAETYVLLLLDIIYSYMTLMLFFGLFHCFSIICGTPCISPSEADGPLHFSHSLALNRGTQNHKGGFLFPLLLGQSTWPYFEK